MKLLIFAAAKTVDLKAELGKTLSLETIEAELKKSKPAVLFVCQVCRLMICSYCETA